MKNQYEQGELNTPKQHHVNFIIMEQASETATELTELECKNLDIVCWVEDDNEHCKSFSPNAQDIFNGHYDHKMDEIYKLVNAMLNVHEKAGEPEEPRIFEITRERLQAHAMEKIGRELTDQEIETATNGILSGLEFDIDTVLDTAIWDAVDINK